MMFPKSSCAFMRRLHYTSLLLVVFLVLYLFYTLSFTSLTQRFKLLHPGPKPVLVLVWFWPFNKPFDLDICESKFNIPDCFLTVDRELYDQADAVLIHHKDIAWDSSNLPASPRPPHQKWIWMNCESPSNTERTPGLGNLFNVSLNYRKDADIGIPYGWLIPVEQELEDFVPPEKNNLVCWIVSNYKLHQKRVLYYEELQKYVPVHKYGDYFDGRITDEEYRKIISSCKFYLSFENSEHKDYITEKFFNALDLGAVPIVLGPSRRTYERIVPGDAFIHVEDFPSIGALSEHLLRLDNNDALYQDYFRWRRHFKVKVSSFPEEHACHSCDYIRKHREYQVLMELYQWYWGSSEERAAANFI